jgi:hypothetical protein
MSNTLPPVTGLVPSNLKSHLENGPRLSVNQLSLAILMHFLRILASLVPLSSMEATSNTLFLRLIKEKWQSLDLKVLKISTGKLLENTSPLEADA